MCIATGGATKDKEANAMSRAFFGRDDLRVFGTQEYMNKRSLLNSATGASPAPSGEGFYDTVRKPMGSDAGNPARGTYRPGIYNNVKSK